VITCRESRRSAALGNGDIPTWQMRTKWLGVGWVPLPDGACLVWRRWRG